MSVQDYSKGNKKVMHAHFKPQNSKVKMFDLTKIRLVLKTFKIVSWESSVLALPIIYSKLKPILLLWSSSMEPGLVHMLISATQLFITEAASHTHLIFTHLLFHFFLLVTVLKHSRGHVLWKCEGGRRSAGSRNDPQMRPLLQWLRFIKQNYAYAWLYIFNEFSILRHPDCFLV